MTRIYQAAYIDGRWQVYSTSNGIDDRRNEGPRWDTVKQARAYVDNLELSDLVDGIGHELRRDDQGPPMGR